MLAYFDDAHSDLIGQSFTRAAESTVPGGIIASERIPVPDDIDHLEVRLGQERGSLGARLGFPIDDPASTLVGPKKARVGGLAQSSRQSEKYVESFPTYMAYRPFQNGSERLIITLEMYELLHRLQSGLSESFGRQERVQQLHVFKAALKSRHAPRMVIFDEERKNLEVRVRVTSQTGEEGRKLPRVKFS